MAVRVVVVDAGRDSGSARARPGRARAGRARRRRARAGGVGRLAPARVGGREQRWRAGAGASDAQRAPRARAPAIERVAGEASRSGFGRAQIDARPVRVAAGGPVALTCEAAGRPRSRAEPGSCASAVPGRGARPRGKLSAGSSSGDALAVESGPRRRPSARRLASRERVRVGVQIARLSGRGVMPSSQRNRAQPRVAEEAAPVRARRACTAPGASVFTTWTPRLGDVGSGRRSTA